MHIAFPFAFARGHLRGTDRESYIVQLIEQVLFTVKGERVNRPDFGCGIQYLVFQPENTELAAAVLFMVRGELQRNLEGVAQIESVEAETRGPLLHVTVRYVDPQTQTRHIARYQR